MLTFYHEGNITAITRLIFLSSIGSKTVHHCDMKQLFGPQRLQICTGALSIYTTLAGIVEHGYSEISTLGSIGIIST
jgi:hypothetical protein